MDETRGPNDAKHPPDPEGGQTFSFHSIANTTQIPKIPLIHFSTKT
jgi:hypothetical protein